MVVETMMVGTMVGTDATVAPCPVPARALSDRNLPPLPWRGIFRHAVIAWLATRIALAAVTYFAALFLLARPTSGVAYPGFPTRVTLPGLVHLWDIWDGRNYIAIARGNYPDLYLAAWFPLYPLAIRSAAFLFGSQHWMLAALLVSNLASLGAFVGLGALAAQVRGMASAVPPTLRVMAAYPFALFLAAPYSDGMFLAFACAALLCARRRAWWWVALWAFLAGLTRITAVALILPLAWELWRATRATRATRVPQGRTALLSGVVAVLAVPLALVVYGLYSARHWHDPLAFLHAEAGFWHVLALPWRTLPAAIAVIVQQPTGSYGQAHALLDTVPLLLAIGMLAAMWRRLPSSFGLYTAGILVLCVAAPIVGLGFPDPFASSGRYLLAAAPLALHLGRWATRYPWLDQILVCGGLMLQAVLVATVLTGGWLI